MGEDWKDCIVTLIDLIGIKRLARLGATRASDRMRSLHRFVARFVSVDFQAHDCCYCWNDSALLLAMWDGTKEGALDVISEASRLKDAIDARIGSSYAIMVKGQTFPQEEILPADDRRFIRLRSSSYAMANCFSIEEEARRRKLRDKWYIDSRVTRAAGLQSARTIRMHLLPRLTESRDVLRFRHTVSVPSRAAKSP